MAKEKMEIKTANNAGGKSEAIDAALAQIEKTFGEGSIMRLGNAPMKQIEVIPPSLCTSSQRRKRMAARRHS